MRPMRRIRAGPLAYVPRMFIAQRNALQLLGRQWPIASRECHILMSPARRSRRPLKWFSRPPRAQTMPNRTSLARVLLNSPTESML